MSQIEQVINDKMQASRDTDKYHYEQSTSLNDGVSSPFEQDNALIPIKVRTSRNAMLQKSEN